MFRKTAILFSFLFILCTNAFAANAPTKVVFSDAGWDSVKFHTAVAGFIGRHAYNIQTETISGSSSIVQAALVRGDIDVNMELWTDNVPSYKDDMATGKLVDLGTNFNDNKQGFYVPRYLIYGDPERGLKPLAPDLRSVRDLKRYAHLFQTNEATGKGRIYGAIPGWAIDEILYKKFMAYGLDKNFVYFRSGSEPTLNSAFLAAYAKGEAIVGYNYEPTWVTGKLDLVLLQDEPYTEAGFLQGLTEARSVPVLIVANKQLLNKAPEFAEFLRHYHTSSSLTAEALAYIADTKCSYEEAARWFLTRHPELISQWLPDEKQALVKTALENKIVVRDSWLLHFPETWHVDLTAPIDNFVKHINQAYGDFFNEVKILLGKSINSIEHMLNMLPWWLVIGITGFAGRYLTGKTFYGFLYGLGLFSIGCFGYWSLMNETLAVIITSVILSLLIGLPIGIMVSTIPMANKLLRPLLDAMQTMPTFVYMIPAVMLLGPGKVPAVLATIIYAVVPVIRLTSHGIQQVDQDIVEASVSFGASRWQTLLKVQIPQALPTIMTGVNQTMMMAIAMVVTCAMIGANGLGMEVLIAINRTESGRGLIAGISIVIIAIIIDRLTQSLSKRL